MFASPRALENLTSSTTFAEGIGERFTDIEAPPAWYLVLVPPVSVPTQEIFRSPLLRRDTPAILPTDWRAGYGANDLEPVACKLYPVVAKALDWLRSFGDARMSGSGSCCFVELSGEAAAQQAIGQIPAGMTGFIARGLDCHPLVNLT